MSSVVRNSTGREFLGGSYPRKKSFPPFPTDHRYMVADTTTPLAYIEIVVDTAYSVLAMFTFRVSNIDNATTRIRSCRWLFINKKSPQA